MKVTPVSRALLFAKGWKGGAEVRPIGNVGGEMGAGFWSYLHVKPTAKLRARKSRVVRPAFATRRVSLKESTPLVPFDESSAPVSLLRLKRASALTLNPVSLVSDHSSPAKRRAEWIWTPSRLLPGTCT